MSLSSVSESIETTLLKENENAQSSIPKPAANTKTLFPLKMFDLYKANSSELHCSMLLLVTNPPPLINCGVFSLACDLSEACIAAKFAFSLFVLEYLYKNVSIPEQIASSVNKLISVFKIFGLILCYYKFVMKIVKILLVAFIFTALVVACGGRRDRCPSVYKNNQEQAIFTA